MRLSDEQKNASTPMNRQQKSLITLIRKMNIQRLFLKNTEGLQKKVYDEIVGRIKKDDESVPYFKNGYYYYNKYSEGSEYPVYLPEKRFS